MPASQVSARRDGLNRLSVLSRWTFAAGIALTGVFSGLAAASFRGHTSAGGTAAGSGGTTSPNGASASSGNPTSPGSPASSSLQPSSSPLSPGRGPAHITSGGS